jgi:hypothetical protein
MQFKYSDDQLGHHMSLYVYISRQYTLYWTQFSTVQLMYSTTHYIQLGMGQYRSDTKYSIPIDTKVLNKSICTGNW